MVRSVCLFVFRFSKHLSHAKTGSSVCLGKYYRQRKASVCYTVPGARTPDSKAVIPALLLTQSDRHVTTALHFPHSAEEEPYSAISHRHCEASGAGPCTS